MDTATAARGNGSDAVGSAAWVVPVEKDRQGNNNLRSENMEMDTNTVVFEADSRNLKFEILLHKVWFDVFTTQTFSNFSLHCVLDLTSWLSLIHI